MQFSNAKWKENVEQTISAQELESIRCRDQFENAFQFAVFVSVLRQDFVSQALSYACEQILGDPKLIFDPLQNGIELSGGMQQPLLIYTASGQDPTSVLANQHILALAPGREKEADEQLEQILDQIGRHQEQDAGATDVVIVKGAHLCLQWL